MSRDFFHLLRKGGAKTFQTIGFVYVFALFVDCRRGYYPPAFLCVKILFRKISLFSGRVISPTPTEYLFYYALIFSFFHPLYQKLISACFSADS